MAAIELEDFLPGLEFWDFRIQDKSVKIANFRCACWSDDADCRQPEPRGDVERQRVAAQKRVNLRKYADELGQRMACQCGAYRGVAVTALEDLLGLGDLGGPPQEQNIDVKLVIHGPALPLFDKDKIDPELKKKFDLILEDGAHAEMCQVSMKLFGKPLEDLIPGLEATLHPVAVKRIADLQAQGYLYIKP